MKQSIVKIFTFSLLVSSISFISCVDNEKNLFNADQLKQIYEETFPVKNIDSDGDWTMSRSVTAHVSINGDQGVDYKIQIFDADPLSPESTAKLLAEGTATQSMTLDVVMDCATSLDKVFVARIDEHKRYLVQPTAIENGTVTAHFGDKGTPTRSISRAVTTSIPVMEAPYTADFISAKKAISTVIQANWDLSAKSGWGGSYGQFPVFTESERWFKIQEGTFKAGFSATGNRDGEISAVKVIVPQGSTWVIENSNQFSDITEIIVENGGKIEIAKNGSLILTRASYITVMQGGSIVGDRGIQITTVFNISIIVAIYIFDFNGSMIYQCRTICRSIIRIQFKCSIIHKINSVSTSINFQKVTINRTRIIVCTPSRTICYLNTSVTNNTSSLHHSYIRSPR